MNTTLQSVTGFTPELNDVWGYASGGKEYALVGLKTGVNIQDVTDPANPVDLGTTTGPSTIWRDIKTFGSYAYVTNEHSGGLQIIDLSNLPTPITSSDYSNWAPSIPGVGTLVDCHNIYIDGNGYGYLAGCNLNSGGILYIDLFTTPGSPTYVDKAPAVYAHDVYVENDIMYTSDIYTGDFTIYDVSNKSNTLFLGDGETPNAFTHNAWSNSTGTVLFTTDEKANAYVAAYDISDPANPEELDRFRPLASVGTNVIPHNVHVAGDFLVISHYSDGVVIVDASTPDNMIEVGNYDTYTGGGTGFNGAWGAFPFLPSQNILVSDQDNGLFVISPTYVYAAKLEGFITDMATGLPIAGATITINAAQANEGVTDFTGEYKTGIATAGTYSVTISKPGYADQVVMVTIANGVATPLNVALGVALPIELISFDAKPTRAADVLLNWDAVQTDDQFEFELQRSIDGQNYRTIDTQIASAIDGVATSFSYLDEQPGSGTLYYRLKMIEADRSFKYSEIKQIAINKTGQISMYPNPVDATTSALYIQGDFVRNQEYTLSIISSLGQRKTLTLKGEMLNEISTDFFSTGINYVEIIENGVPIYQTQIVKN